MAGAALLQSTPDELVAQFASGRTAPPNWVARCVGLLQERYEHELGLVRQHEVDLSQKLEKAQADLAKPGPDVSHLHTAVARSEALCGSAVAERDEALREAKSLRLALERTHLANDELERRCAAQERELSDMKGSLGEAERQLRLATEAATRERERGDELSFALDQTDEVVEQVNMAHKRTCAALDTSERRVEQQTRAMLELSTKAATESGAGDGGSDARAEELEHLKKERDGLLRLLAELHRTGGFPEGVRTAHAVRVGGGFEAMTDYVKRLTAALPKEVAAVVERTPWEAQGEATAANDRSLETSPSLQRLGSRGALRRGGSSSDLLGSRQSSFEMPGSPAMQMTGRPSSAAPAALRSGLPKSDSRSSLRSAVGSLARPLFPSASTLSPNLAGMGILVHEQRAPG